VVECSELAGKDSNLDLTAPKAAVLPLHHPPIAGGLRPPQTPQTRCSGYLS
jgi:hypothetical protein